MVEEAPVQAPIAEPIKEPVPPPVKETPSEGFDINKFMEGLNADVAKEETEKMTSFQKTSDDKLMAVAKALTEQQTANVNDQVAKLAQIIENQNKQITDLSAKFGESTDGTQAPLGQTTNPFNEAPVPQKNNFNENDPALKQAFFKKFNI